MRSKRRASVDSPQHKISNPQEDQQGSTQPGRDPQDARGVRALSEAADLLESAAKFYSGRVEATLGHRWGAVSHGELDLPCDEVRTVWRLSQCSTHRTDHDLDHLHPTHTCR